jgi:hypothetical protein
MGEGEGVHLLVHFFRASDHRLHQFDRRQLARTEQGKRFGRAQIAQVEIAHGSPPQRNAFKRRKKDPGGADRRGFEDEIYFSTSVQILV